MTKKPNELKRDNEHESGVFFCRNKDILKKKEHFYPLESYRKEVSKTECDFSTKWTYKPKWKKEISDRF